MNKKQIWLLPKEMQKDKNIILNTVKEDGMALNFVSHNNTMIDDKDIVLAAVKNNGSALKFASPRLRNNLEIVIEAINSEGAALRYASKKLKNNKEIVLLAIKQDYANLQFASQEIKKLLNNESDKIMVLTSLAQEEKLNEFIPIIRNKKKIKI